jgi:PKD repeat protein
MVVIHFRLFLLIFLRGHQQAGPGILETGKHLLSQNPSIVYSSPGTYTVTLTVTNGLGNNSITKTNYIVVDPSPAANFGVSSNNGCTPFPVTFTDLSGGASGTITNWSWDFGDGTTSNQQSPTHIYNIDSFYTVKLTIQNSIGCTDSVIMVNAVNVGAKPVPDFVTIHRDVCASVAVNFNNKTTGNYTSCLWYFGDGDTSTKVGPGASLS